MADGDNSLDDFFAKKDKSKKKSKPKSSSLASDLPSTAAEDSVKPKKKKKASKEKSSQNQSSGSSSQIGLKEDEDEWILIEENEADYSGLRIQNLQISKEEVEPERDDEQGDDEDGESSEYRENSQGPWKKSSQQESSTISVPIEAPEEEKKEEPVKAPAKYVPPGVRRAMRENQYNPSPRRRGRHEAPNIQSDIDFPTLGGSSNADRQTEKMLERENQSSRFETVRTGNRQLDDNSKRGLQLELGNKYNALQDQN